MSGTNTVDDAKVEPRKQYATPRLLRLGTIHQVTQKSGGSEDGSAAMMDKSGGG